MWHVAQSCFHFGQKVVNHHTAHETMDQLRPEFGEQLILRLGPVNWPSRSCDLTPLDILCVKVHVYKDWSSESQYWTMYTWNTGRWLRESVSKMDLAHRPLKVVLNYYWSFYRFESINFFKLLLKKSPVISLLPNSNRFRVNKFPRNFGTEKQ